MAGSEINAPDMSVLDPDSSVSQILIVILGNKLELTIVLQRTSL